eukprot:5781959-Alexandrium_andersonii.AAC.1
MTFASAGFMAQHESFAGFLDARKVEPQLSREFQAAYDRLVQYLQDHDCQRFGKQVKRLLEGALVEARAKSVEASGS